MCANKLQQSANADALGFDQKDQIREQLAQAIADGKSEIELSTLRLVLAEKFKANPNTVRSIAAYVRYWATLALKKTHLTNVFTRDEVVFMHNYYSAGANKDAAIGELANHLSTVKGTEVSVEDVKETIFAYQTKIDEYKKKEKVKESKTMDRDQDTVIGVEQLTKETAESVEAIKLPHATGFVDEKEIETDDLITGEDIDYDNPEKNEWRMEWIKFIEKNSTPDERSKMKVLCFPGKRCLEAVAYINIGFKPENIIGVEGGKKQNTREEFLATASRIGIKPRIGKLEKILPQDPERYAVVSLDFCGPMCERNYKILSELLFADKAFFLLNTLNKRENDLAKKRLLSAQTPLDTRQQIISESRSPQEAELKMNKLLDQLQISIYKGQISDYDLQEARSHHIAYMMIGAGDNRRDNCMFPNAFPILQNAIAVGGKFSDESCEANEVIHDVEHNVMDDFSRFLLSHATQFEAQVGPIHLSNLALYAYTRRFLVQQHQKYDYLSRNDSAKRASPFSSHFMFLNTPSDLYFHSRETVNFYLTCLEQRLRHKLKREEKGKFLLRDKSLAIKQSGHKFSRSDTIAYTLNSKTIASVPWRSFGNALEKWSKMYDEALNLSIHTGGKPIEMPVKNDLGQIN